MAEKESSQIHRFCCAAWVVKHISRKFLGKWYAAVLNKNPTYPMRDNSISICSMQVTQILVKGLLQDSLYTGRDYYICN